MFDILSYIVYKRSVKGGKMPHILQALNQDNPLKNNEKIVQGGGVL